MKTKINHFDVLRKLISLIVVMTMLMGMTTSIFAQEKLANEQQHEQEIELSEKLKEIERQSARYEEAMQQMEQHIHVGEDGLFHLRIDSGQEIDIDEELFRELSFALTQTNNLIASKKLTLDEIAFSNGQNIFGNDILRENSNNIIDCAGWTGVTITWLGPRVHLNHCHTGVLTSMMLAGAGASAICAALSAFLGQAYITLICGVIGGLYAIGAQTINAINALGGYNGIWIQITWAGNLDWLWHQ